VARRYSTVSKRALSTLSREGGAAAEKTAAAASQRAVSDLSVWRRFFQWNFTDETKKESCCLSSTRACFTLVSKLRIAMTETYDKLSRPRFVRCLPVKRRTSALFRCFKHHSRRSPDFFYLRPRPRPPLFLPSPLRVLSSPCLFRFTQKRQQQQAWPLIVVAGGAGLWYAKENGLLDDFLGGAPSSSSVGDYAAVRKAVADILDVENYDDGSYSPLLVRLAWHSGMRKKAFWWSKKSGRSGEEREERGEEELVLFFSSEDFEHIFSHLFIHFFFNQNLHKLTKLP